MKTTTLGLIALVVLSMSARAEDKICAPGEKILTSLRVMDRKIVEVSEPAEVTRGLDFLAAHTGQREEPIPDRLYIVSGNGTYALMVGYHGLICMPDPMDESFYQKLLTAIFGRPA